jgi:hypothetical protein
VPLFKRAYVGSLTGAIQGIVLDSYWGVLGPIWGSGIVLVLMRLSICARGGWAGFGRVLARSRSRHHAHATQANRTSAYAPYHIRALASPAAANCTSAYAPYQLGGGRALCPARERVWHPHKITLVETPSNANCEF